MFHTIYLSRKDSTQKWGKPIHLGYPIKTIADEGALCINRTGETAYFSTWLYRITWNVATDERRQFAKYGASVAEDLTEVETRLSRPQDSPDLMQLHYQDLIQRGLQSLSLDHRAVLVLHDLEDLPQKEVAEILHLPTGTVKSRLFYARQAIRTFLEQQGVHDASISES